MELLAEHNLDSKISFEVSFVFSFGTSNIISFILFNFYINQKIYVKWFNDECKI